MDKIYMNVIPYTHFDGIPTLRDSDLYRLYEKMERDGTKGIVFYDMEMNEFDFVNYIKAQGLFVAYEDKEPLAFGWLNKFEHKTAHAHFCFFSEAWDLRSIDIGKQLISAALDGYGLDMLIGCVPSFNKAAAKFALKCGAQFGCELPFGAVDSKGKSHGTTIVYYVR